MRVLLAIPLEDSLCSLRGVKRTASVSRDGVCSVMLEYQWGTDMPAAAVEARERIDAVYPSLPSQAAKPRVLSVDPGDQVILLVGVFPRSGDMSFARRLAEREIRTRLQQVSGVGMVTLVGGTREEVRVLVDQDKAAARGATLSDVAGALADWNVDLPAGSITEGQAELLVRTEGAVRDLSALGELRAAGTAGDFPLRDIARVERGTAVRASLFQVDGREGVGLQVRRRPGSSPVTLSRAVREELDRLRAAYGRDLDLAMVRDASVFITRSVSDLALSALAGAAIAFVVVLLFVRDPVTSLILVSSVPLSIVVALLLLRVAGRSLNVMSIGGLSMGIGMMMDNSVVILENLQRRVAPGPGKPVMQDAIVGAVREMSGSNTGATVTSIVVFVPVIFLPGVIGAVFTDLALSVVFSQVISYLVSITLIPAVFRVTGGARARRWGVRTQAPGRKEMRLQRRRGTARLEAGFRRVFRILFRRPILLALVLVVTTGAGIASLRALPFEFLPPVDTGEISVTVTLPGGSAIDAAGRVGESLARRVLAIEGVRSVHARAGGEDDDLSYLADAGDSQDVLHVTVMLAAGRRPPASAVAKEIRQRLEGGTGQVAVQLPGKHRSPAAGALRGQDGAARARRQPGAGHRPGPRAERRAGGERGSAGGDALSPRREARASHHSRQAGHRAKRR